MLVLASVAANHKTVTEADVLNKIAGQNEEEVHEVVYEEVRSWQNWCWGRGKMIMMKETKYFENFWIYGTTTQFYSNFPVNIQLS